MTKTVSANIVLPLACNRQLPEPLHRQLYDQLRALILAGRLSPGVRLPSSRTLAADHGVSRNTVVSAYDQVAGRGLRHRHGGVGDLCVDRLAGRSPDGAIRRFWPGSPTSTISRSINRRGF